MPFLQGIRRHEIVYSSSDFWDIVPSLVLQAKRNESALKRSKNTLKKSNAGYSNHRERPAPIASA
jgi:hypothetical protein